MHSITKRFNQNSKLVLLNFITFLINMNKLFKYFHSNHSLKTQYCLTNWYTVNKIHKIMQLYNDYHIIQLNNIITWINFSRCKWVDKSLNRNTVNQIHWYFTFKYLSKNNRPDNHADLIRSPLLISFDQ